MSQETLRKTPGFIHRALAITSNRFVYIRSTKEQAAEFYKHSDRAQNERVSRDVGDSQALSNQHTPTAFPFPVSDFPYLYL